MWTRAPFCAGGSQRFFYLSFGNGGLKEFFTTNFMLLHSHKIDFRIFDDMVPWEKDAYMNLLVSKIKEENEAIKLREMESKSRSKR